MQALSSREQEVAHLAASGHSNQEIGDRLQISVQTVKNHMQSIFRKLALANRVELTLRIARDRRRFASQRRNIRRVRSGGR